MKHIDTITILLVEDNDQMRNLMTSILRCIGVKEVIKVHEGGEAIETLKSYPRNSKKYGGCPFDVIISDWVMSPVDGISLLRWVRQHPDSPNPFIPFIMVSAIVDTIRVTRARDLGANDFLAKPFSIESLTSHLWSILMNDKIFIKSKNFFGPDRRKRTLTNIVYEKRGQSDEKEKIKHEEYIIPSVLNQKNDLNKGLVEDNYNVIDNSIIQKVKKELFEQTGNFMSAFLNYIASLEADINSCCYLSETKRKPYFERIKMIAHELRGLGGLFEYPLVAIVAQSLYDLTSIYDLTDECLELIKSHVDSFKAIVRGKIRGMGGDVGRELIRSLDIANQRFLHRNDQKIFF